MNDSGITVDVSSICAFLYFYFFYIENSFVFFFFNKFIYLFMAALASLLRAGFLWLRRAGATLCYGAQASHCGGFSCCRARALGMRASVVVACGVQ